MTGMILDGLLMLLLVAALAYGVRLERKLSALRAGQQAFASAVSELNAAAGRAESALASLRASGQETDLLHDRILKAREVKAQLEGLIARGGTDPAFPRTGAGRSATDGQGQASPDGVHRLQNLARAEAASLSSPSTMGVDNAVDQRAARMAALAERIQGMAAPVPLGNAPVAAILGALTAGRTGNQSGKPNLNPARRNLDEDLFAA